MVSEEEEAKAAQEAQELWRSRTRDLAMCLSVTSCRSAGMFLTKPRVVARYEDGDIVCIAERGLSEESATGLCPRHSPLGDVRFQVKFALR